MGDVSDRIESGAAEAADSRGFQYLARGGFVMSGIVHVLIGWIAVQVAIGGGGEDADQSGALRMIAQAPGGQILLWVGGIAMVALTLWLLLNAWFSGQRADGLTDTAREVGRNLGKAVLYGALAVTVLRFAAGAGSSSSEQTESLTAGVLGTPGGRILVLLAAAVVAGVGIGHIAMGVTRRFLKQLERSGGLTVGAALKITGTVGYLSKGIAFVAVGVLLGWAGIAADPEKATGLDGALHSIAALPAGVVMLSLVGVGLVIFGVYCFFRARYEDM